MVAGTAGGWAGRGSLAMEFELPRTCICCDALLMGGATVHKPGCEIGALIEEKFPSIRCPRCGMRSYNPHDIDQRYCGNCHAFHADLVREAGENQ